MGLHAPSRRLRRPPLAVLFFALGALVATGLAAAQEPPAGVTAADAARAGYSLEGYDEPVTLVAGRWEGERYGPDSPARPIVELIDPLVRLGDLDGDGADETVVGLEESGGGTGRFLYLAVLDRREGEVANVASAWVGDRIPVRSLEVAEGRIVLESLQEGPGDAACCKFTKVRQAFEVQDGALVEVAREEQGRVALADLEGTRWVLESLGDGATALPDPPVTLAFEGDRLSGHAGCNSYQGPVGNPDLTDLEIGPLLATLSTCAPLVQAQEDEYLAKLGFAYLFGYDAGRLALRYEADGPPQTLLFRDGGPVMDADR